MSRRGNCHDKAVAESFFSMLKTERIKRRIYPTRSEAPGDIFKYIELFSSQVRHHGNNDGLLTNDYERRCLGSYQVSRFGGADHYRLRRIVYGRNIEIRVPSDFNVSPDPIR